MGEMTNEEIYRKYAEDLVRFATGTHRRAGRRD
jgi:hypothetical protein